MKIVGIDYGRKKIGLAVAETALAVPLKVVTGERLFEKVVAEIEKLRPEKIVVGVSEGEMAEESHEFGRRLGKKTNVEVSFFDETLSTLDAQEAAISAGIGRIKRKKMEDAYAATIMLQSYLENV